MEEHPVIEREHTRVHEENKTEAGKVWWVRPVGLDDVGGPAGRCGSGRMKMGAAREGQGFRHPWRVTGRGTDG